MRKIPAHIVAQYMKELSWLDEQTKQSYKDNFNIKWLFEWETFFEDIGGSDTLLNFAFDWMFTEQGHDFWYEQEQHILRQMSLEREYVKNKS